MDIPLKKKEHKVDDKTKKKNTPKTLLGWQTHSTTQKPTQKPAQGVRESRASANEIAKESARSERESNHHHIIQRTEIQAYSDYPLVPIPFPKRELS